MSYIDLEYYNNEYKGVPVDEDAFFRLAKRSSDVIDMLTNHVLLGFEFERMALFIQEQVKKAVASQVEYLATSGEEKALGGGGFGQVSAGNFSYGDKAGKEGLSRSEEMTSQAVISYLSPTGLLYQGVDSCG